MSNKFNQELFFKSLEKSVPANTKMVAILSDLLNLDQSNAYRRIRGNKELTISEFLIISENFPEAKRLLNDTIDHQQVGVGISDFKDVAGFKQYLKDTIKNLSQALNVNHSLQYMARDLPIFLYFSQPTLMKFKVAVWFKSGSSHKEIEVDDEIIALGQSFFELYQKLNTAELWYENGFLNQLEQLNYWHDLDFITDEDKNAIIDEMKTSFDLYEQWLADGTKPGGGSIAIYQSSFSTMGDGGLLEAAGKKQVISRIQGIHQMKSSHPLFVELFENHWEAHCKLASPLMTNNQRSRHLFFKRIKDELQLKSPQ